MIALLISGGNFVSGSASANTAFAMQGTVKIFNNVFLPLLMAGILYIISICRKK